MTIEPILARVGGRATMLPPIPTDYERLELLFQVQSVLARSSTIDQACTIVLPIVTRALRVRTAVLVDATTPPSRTLAWIAAGLAPAAADRARGHAHAVLADFAPLAAPQIEPTGVLPGGVAEDTLAAPFITIPLSLPCGDVFGVFQLEGAGAFDERDLLFINAVATQLASVLDGHHTKLALETACEDAERAVRARDAILGVVSHDLRSPLTAIQLSMELLATMGPVVAQPVAILLRAVETMVRLIDDLLDVGSIESGHLSIATSVTEARALVHAAVDDVRAAAAKDDIRIELALPDHDVPLVCDRVRVVQVLTNLLSNALKFTRAGDVITVSVTEEPEQIRFAIADTGCGIAPDDLDHVFDRYWQAEATAHLGTGLGLAIVKGIVDAHDGTISVDSRLAHGTTFAFVLPA